MDKEFYFLIAAKWPQSQGLRIFRFRDGEVQKGTEMFMRQQLSYVRDFHNQESRYAFEPNPNDYFVHIINPTKINL